MESKPIHQQQAQDQQSEYVNPQSIRQFTDMQSESQIESMMQPQADKWKKKEKLTRGQIKLMKKKAEKQAEIENQKMNEEIQMDVQRQEAIEEIMAQEIC